MAKQWRETYNQWEKAIAPGLEQIDHETEGDTETRLEYVTEWLGGELVDCYAADAPRSGLHCSKHDGEWTAELKALMVDGLNTAKNRKRITALVVELLIAECEDNNDDD